MKLDLTAAVEAAARAAWDDVRDRCALTPSTWQPPAWEDAAPMSQALAKEAALVYVVAAAPLIEAAVRDGVVAEVTRINHDFDARWRAMFAMWQS
jgi:hypothetical protein